MESEHKTSVYEYFTSTSVLKYCVCQCIISEDGGEKMCDEKISASSATTPMLPHVLPTWKDIWVVFILSIWNWCKRKILLCLGHQQHQILNLEYWKKAYYSNLTVFC